MLRFTVKRAKGKVYYYKEEDGVRTRATKKDYLKYKAVNTSIYSKTKNSVTNEKLFERAVKHRMKEYNETEDASKRYIKRQLAAVPKRKKITYKYLKAINTKNKIMKFLANLNYTIDDVMAETSSPEEWILDESHWIDNTFVAETGKRYLVEFRYDGSAFKEI